MQNPKNNLIILFVLFAALFVSIFYFYHKFFLNSAGSIYLEHQSPMIYENSEFHIVSIKADDLKVPFFGTAFHINYDPQNFKYEHFTLGNFFSSQDDPLIIVNESTVQKSEIIDTKNREIIIGISLKRGQTISKSDGLLLQLYFKNKNSVLNQNHTGNFYFSDAVFSTFDKGRKDLNNITFSPSQKMQDNQPL